MGMCKDCKEVFPALEMKNGYCKGCQTEENTIEEVPKKREKTLAEHITLYVGSAIGLFVFFMMVAPSKHHEVKKKTYTIDTPYITKNKTIGCEDKNELYTAIREFRHGGLTALMPYVVGNAKCLYIPNKNVRLIKMTDFAYLIYFDNPDGDSRFLWIDEDEIH